MGDAIDVAVGDVVTLEKHEDGARHVATLRVTEVGGGRLNGDQPNPIDPGDYGLTYGLGEWAVVAVKKGRRG